MDFKERKMNFREIVLKRSFYYFNLVLLFILLNGLCSNIGGRLDLSKDQTNSISPSTAKVFKNLDEPVLIEAYISSQVTGEITSEIQPIISMLNEMVRVAGKKINLRIINPNTEELQTKAQERGIQGIPISEQKEVESSVRLGFFGIFIQKGESSAVVSLINQNWFIDDVEYRILKEIKKLSGKKEKSNIAFVNSVGSSKITTWTKQQDQNKDNLYAFKMTLDKELGSTSELNLEEKVPSNIQTLILTGLPVFEPKELYNLDQFLMRGGNVIAMLSAFKFQMQEANQQMMQMGLPGGGAGYGSANVDQVELKKLNDWLGNYGLGLKGEILLEPSQALPIWDFQGNFARQITYPAWAVYTRESKNLLGDYPALKPIQQLVFPWFSSITLIPNKQTNVKFETIVQSSPQAVSLPFANLNFQELSTVANSGQKIGFQASLVGLATGKFKSAYPNVNELPQGVEKSLHLAEQIEDVEASTKTKTKVYTKSNIVLIGSPYLVCDLLLKNQTGASVFSLNSAFLMNLLETVDGDTDLIEARSRKHTFTTLVIKNKFIQKFIAWTFSLGLPLGIAIWGASRMTQRSRKRGFEK